MIDKDVKHLENIIPDAFLLDIIIRKDVFICVTNKKNRK